MPREHCSLEINCGVIFKLFKRKVRDMTKKKKEVKDQKILKNVPK